MDQDQSEIGQFSEKNGHDIKSNKPDKFAGKNDQSNKS